MTDETIATHKMVEALFKKLDRIETKVDNASGQNSENYRLLSILETRTVGNEARIKRLEDEIQEEEAHRRMCAEHRGQCPKEEFETFRRWIWGLVAGFLLQTVALLFSLMKTLGGK